MTLRKRIALAWAIITGRMGISVFRRSGGTMKLVHSTIDESEMLQTSKVALRRVMKSESATRIVLAVGSAAMAAEILNEVAPLMKSPVHPDRKDIN